MYQPNLLYWKIRATCWSIILSLFSPLHISLIFVLWFQMFIYLLGHILPNQIMYLWKLIKRTLNWSKQEIKFNKKYFYIFWIFGNPKKTLTRWMILIFVHSWKLNVQTHSNSKMDRLGKLKIICSIMGGWTIAQ